MVDKPSSKLSVVLEINSSRTHTSDGRQKIYSACIAKSCCGEDKFIFELFDKVKSFFKNPLWFFNILNMVYTIYVPS